MSTHVHEMAIASERKLLHAQAARGWQIEEAAATNRKTIEAGRRLDLVSASALARAGQMLVAVAALLRQLSA